MTREQVALAIELVREVSLLDGVRDDARKRKHAIADSLRAIGGLNARLGDDYVAAAILPLLGAWLLVEGLPDDDAATPPGEREAAS